MRADHPTDAGDADGEAGSDGRPNASLPAPAPCACGFPKVNIASVTRKDMVVHQAGCVAHAPPHEVPHPEVAHPEAPHPEVPEPHAI